MGKENKKATTGGRADSEIKDDVWKALSHDIRVDADRIGAEVAGGTVFLKGTVTSLYDKRILNGIVGRIKGVMGVVNEVAIAPTVKRPDGEIASEIRAALTRNTWVDEDKLEVSVIDGVVRLTGQVHTYTQKYYAESYAWSVPGIVDIVNDIVIEAKYPRADAEMARDVEKELERNVRVDPDAVSVEANDGVIYLRGSVANHEQKRLAEDIAWWTTGVTDVVNELAVQP